MKSAWEWYTKAAEQENPRAIYNIALMKEKGLGTRLDPHGAISWYERAAEAGR